MALSAHTCAAAHRPGNYLPEFDKNWPCLCQERPLGGADAEYLLQPHTMIDFISNQTQPGALESVFPLYKQLEAVQRLSPWFVTLQLIWEWDLYCFW